MHVSRLLRVTATCGISWHGPATLSLLSLYKPISFTMPTQDTHTRMSGIRCYQDESCYLLTLTSMFTVRAETELLLVVLPSQQRFLHQVRT